MHVSETETLFNNDRGERDRDLFILYRSSESTTLTLSERLKSKVTLVLAPAVVQGPNRRVPLFYHTTVLTVHCSLDSFVSYSRYLGMVIKILLLARGVRHDGFCSM